LEFHNFNSAFSKIANLRAFFWRKREKTNKTPDRGLMFFILCFLHSFVAHSAEKRWTAVSLLTGLYCSSFSTFH